jgi:hypothetical protein
LVLDFAEAGMFASAGIFLHRLLGKAAVGERLRAVNPSKKLLIFLARLLPAVEAINS